MTTSNKSYQERLLNVIPGGAHTYSRGFDQFPGNAPEIMVRGKGATSFDANNKAYLDYGMALRAVNIGYAQDEIDDAAIAQIKAGNNLTRASMIELEAAELLVELIDSFDMVKFTKNGSTAVSAAVKLARAYTGKDQVLRCHDHPFFSYDDWFIGSTAIQKGIPQAIIELTTSFPYNDVARLEAILSQEADKIACLVMEPCTTHEPAPSKYFEGKTFLHDVAFLCKKHNVVFILDEMITGFRWDLKGAQHYYQITPDLSTFGKAMANGYSVAAVGGKREIMSLGSIEKVGQERLFLLSTTHGAEMSGLGAFVATVNYLKQHNVIEHIWRYGRKFIAVFNECARAQGVEDFVEAGGFACSPYYLTKDANGEMSLAFRTLFAQEMVKQGVLMPWVALCYQHDEKALAQTKTALLHTFAVYKKALASGIDAYLESDAIKPVFRQYN